MKKKTKPKFVFVATYITGTSDDKGVAEEMIFEGPVPAKMMKQRPERFYLVLDKLPNWHSGIFRGTVIIKTRK